MKKIPVVLIILLYLFQLCVGAFLIYKVSFNQVSKHLTTIVERVAEDIKYVDGKWDTYLYNSDPLLPGTYPLYILSSDGFVIDRWKPVRGYLDVSDFKHLLDFEKPKTVTTIANQTWRILSQPIISNQKTIGVITVSSFSPLENEIAAIDAKLQEDIRNIASKISVEGNDINLSQFDVRQIRYDTTFQIVNQYNKILAKNNNNNSIDRLPNFIDSSYVEQELKSKRNKIIQDSATHERFIVILRPILDDHQDPVGIIVAGQSIDLIFDLLKRYILWQLAIMIPVCLGFIFVSKKIMNTKGNIPEELSKKKISDIKRVRFDSKASAIHIDDEVIYIPYATNQYYLCKALFAFPQKRWEVDELSDKFGENKEENNWRSVYDAMTLLNKKVGAVVHEKLVVLRNKTYQINPLFASKLG